MRALRCSIFAGLLFATLSIQPARADINAVDVAFDAIVAAAVGLGGVPINAEEATFLKAMVECAAAGKPIAQCAEQAVISAALANAPEEAQKFAACLATSGDVARCAKEAIVDAIVANMPGGVAKDFANCIANGGDPAFCVKQVVLSQVPEQARPLMQCIADGGDAKDCIEKIAAEAAKVAIALDPATQKAINDARDAITAAEKAEDTANNLIKNIQELIEGIQQSDYGKILHAGGAELVKAVCNVILSIFLTPAAAQALAPVVDDMVQNRADLVQDLLKAAHNGDAVKVGQLVLEFWLTMHIEEPCALLPPGDFNDAVCGNLGKLITTVGNAAGDVAKDLLGLGKDFLKDIGLYQIGDELVTWVVGEACDVPGLGVVVGWLGACDKPPPPPQDCGTAQDYFASHFLACIPAGANAAAGGAYPVTSAALVNQCTAALGRCYSNAAQACQAMQSTYGGLVDKLRSGLAQGADYYATSGAATAFALSKGDAACDSDFWDKYRNEFINDCTNALKKTVPWSNACTIDTSGTSVAGDLFGRGSPKDARLAACEAAVNKIDGVAITQAIKANHPYCGMRMVCKTTTTLTSSQVHSTPDCKVYETEPGVKINVNCTSLIAAGVGDLFAQGGIQRQSSLGKPAFASVSKDAAARFSKFLCNQPDDPSKVTIEKNIDKDFGVKAPANLLTPSSNSDQSKDPKKKPAAAGKVSKIHPNIELKSRASSGINTSRSPDSTAPRLVKPLNGGAADRLRGVERANRASGGINTSRSPDSAASGGVSAMDRLGGGGVNRTIPSAAFGTTKRGTSSAPTSDPGSVDYGGCARCGQGTFRAPR